MATLFIEIDPNIQSQQWRQDLDGTTYVLKVYWNSRSEFWQMEIYDTDDELLCSAPLVLGEILFSEYPNGVPAGQFILVDVTGEGMSPTLENLSGDVKLFYIEAT